MNLALLIKKLKVLWLVSAKLSPNFSQYLAGIKHILGVKTIFSVPKEISYEEFLLLINSNFSCRERVGAASSDVKAHCSKAYTESPGHSSDLRMLVSKDAFVSKYYPFHDSFGHPVFGSSVLRGDLRDASSYPCGYPGKLSLKLKKPDAYESQAIFVPYLFFNHFGHALTEVASSIYPLLLLALENPRYLSFPVIIPYQFREYAEKLSLLLGIDSCRVVAPGRDFMLMKVDELYFPKPTYVLSSFVSQSHHHIVKSLLSLEYGYSCSGAQKINNSAHKKIYISRSRLGNMQRHCLEEGQIEACLRDDGWLIYHPQEYSINHQLLTYQNASFICGLEGSAMHLIFGIKPVCLEKVIVLTEKVSNDFALQFASQGIPFCIIDCLVRDFPCRSGVLAGSAHVRLKTNYSPQKLVDKIIAEVMQLAN